MESEGISADDHGYSMIKYENNHEYQKVCHQLNKFLPDRPMKITPDN